MKKNIVTNSAQETKKLGQDFAKKLKVGSVLALKGDLGSGKTTFVQGMAEGLGIKNRIISPTFIIVRTYKLKKGNFYHIDLYRISKKEEIEDLGLDEILNDSSNIVVIEWSEKMKELLPKKRIDIEFFYEKDSKRKIVFGAWNQ